MLKDKIKILVAEDDANLGQLLEDFLSAEGIDVKLCKNGESALHEFNSSHFDLCLLDIMMPKLDGYSLAKEIRTKDQAIPLIFITARSLKEDKLKGYEYGCDDYIIKPFDEEELLWKIKAVVRRAKENKNESNQEIISLGKYQFDFPNQLLSYGDQTIRLTEKEARILNYLSQHRNKVIKREQLLKTLWGENDYFLGRSLDVFITKLRKYLKDDPQLGIENVYKVGLVFKVPVE
jgi:DNA-binding response OmpR family regulator